MEAGAMWYCTKYPGDIEKYIYQPTDFILSIFNAAEKKTLEKDRRQSQKKLEQNIQDILAGKEIIGSSKMTVALGKDIQKAAQTDTTILVRGNSGTGKELVATNIHYQSPRKYEKFVPINCGALPHELIESELFGFEKGSFTGAHTPKPGLLEIAHNGTAFLDEISELPPSAQVKLLRFLQEGEIDKIGRTKKMRVNVRIIAATNKDLEEQVREGKFREDLYYRLNVFSIWLSALTERRDDIPELVNFFIRKFSNEMSRETPVIDKNGMNLLINYHWPGNVRELQNVVQRLLLSDEKKIGAEEVSRALGQISGLNKNKSREISQWDSNNILPWKEMESKLRKEYFQFVRRNSFSDAEAARKLGMAPPNYYRMCKELGLK
jgi:two-component system response regulator AtoC